MNVLHHFSHDARCVLRNMSSRWHQSYLVLVTVPETLILEEVFGKSPGSQSDPARSCDLRQSSSLFPHSSKLFASVMVPSCTLSAAKLQNTGMSITISADRTTSLPKRHDNNDYTIALQSMIPQRSAIQAISQGTPLPPVPNHTDMDKQRRWMLEHLAGAFRVFARKGYAEGMSGHISLRDPEHPDLFWTNP